MQEERDPKTNKLIAIVTHEVNHNEELIGVY